MMPKPKPENVDEIIQGKTVDQTQSLMTDLDEPFTAAESSSTKLELKSLADSAEHPLEVIEKHEKDVSARLGNQDDLDNKFLVTNCEKELNKSNQNVLYTVLETISDYCFSNVGSSYDAEHWGTPKCIAVIEFFYTTTYVT